MTAELRRASDSWNTEPKHIVVKSIEDLKRIDDENNNCGLIISFKSYSGEDELKITIYDDYVE